MGFTPPVGGPIAFGESIFWTEEGRMDPGCIGGFGRKALSFWVKYSGECEVQRPSLTAARLARRKT